MMALSGKYVLVIPTDEQVVVHGPGPVRAAGLGPDARPAGRGPRTRDAALRRS